MRVVLELTDRPPGHLEGTATWAEGPEPVPFTGVLELPSALETATHAGADPSPGVMRRSVIQ